MKAELHQAVSHNGNDKYGDNCNAWSKLHAGPPDVEVGSPSCKDHGPKG
uniref:Uncharacterized protein n=1 Tax=Arundo donax TaxID=35708 RepID=A0A0A8XVE1_ARUDO